MVAGHNCLEPLDRINYHVRTVFYVHLFTFFGDPMDGGNVVVFFFSPSLEQLLPPYTALQPFDHFPLFFVPHLSRVTVPHIPTLPSTRLLVTACIFNLFSCAMIFFIYIFNSSISSS